MSSVLAVPPPQRPAWWPQLLNVVLFQLGWFACVLGVANGWPWAGTVCVIGIAALHLWMAPQPGREARLLACVLLIGLVFDSALLQTGALVYTSGHFPGAFGAALAPHWILASWVLLGTGLNVTMRWLRGRWLMAAVLGAIATPWSFWAGMRLGAARFVDAPLALGLLAVGWAVVMPLLVWLAQRYDGFAKSTDVPHA